MPMLFLDRSYIALGDIMMAILFIVYYFVLLRRLGAFERKTVVTTELSEENSNTTDNTDNPEAEN